ncbi:MAG TPA: SusC/RagA family TonB-linked outer membrane protein, partial [Chitinophagales bacterium]|nr:SusC/RagA family TonB-linked outer membrane protein [Chitinophagales bacterium]
LLSVLFSTAVFAQRTITGTVTGGGEPVIGGAVKVVGATVATVTDFDGKYTIKVPTNYTTLEFSYLGYKTVQKVLDASNVVDVDLEEDAIGLDEVVVTALNIPRKEKTVGYATQDLDGGAFTKAREANVVNSLSGKVAGVNITNSSGAVGASTRITLRGAMSITGSNEPLFVVDGVPIDNKNYGTAGDGGGFDMPNGIADLNPDDIASISVLKGPAASALYGSRGGNGAILITTKKGSGLGKRGFGVSLNSSTTFENPLVLPNFQNSYGQGPDDEYFYWENGSTDDGGVDESWGPPLDVGLEFTQWNSQLNDGKPLPWISVPNNIRDFYDTGMTTSNSIGFTGNNDLISYRLSLGAMNQKGIVPNTDYNRYNVGGNTDFNISSKIKAGISVNYSKALSNNLPTGGYDNENPVQQMIWSGRNVDFSLLEDYENLPLAPVGTAAEGTPLNWNNVFQNNPYWVLHTNLNQLDKDRLIGNVYASWSITKNLTLTAKTGADHWSSLVTERKAIGSNEFQNGYYREIGRRFTERNSDFLLTYKRDVSPDFSFTLSGGGNAMKTNYRFLSGEAPQLELPNLYNLQNIKAGSTPVLINEVQEFAINSLYGLAQLGFRDAIFLDLTGRNDWASVAALDNNSFFYPSAALSVIWTDLFEMDKKTFSFFKTRVSWARTGSMGPLTAYDTQQVYDFRDASFGTLPLAYDPDLLKNPNITPEFTNAFEAGFDVRLLQNKIRLDFTYYNQGGRDLIVPVEVSAASG